MDNENKGLKSIPEIEEILDDEGNDTTDWKTIAYEAVEAGKQYEGLAKRNYSDLEKLRKAKTQESEATPPQEKKKEGPDYAKLAYLETKGVTDEEDIAYIENLEKNSGKNLKELFTANWFQADLKERKEAREAKTAIPQGSRRSSGKPADEIGYYQAKGEMPPKDKPELQRAYVNAKIKADSSGSKFSDNPVV